MSKSNLLPFRKQTPTQDETIFAEVTNGSSTAELAARFRCGRLDIAEAVLREMAREVVTARRERKLRRSA